MPFGTKAAGRNVTKSVAALRGGKNKEANYEQFSEQTPRVVAAKPYAGGKAQLTGNVKGTGKAKEPSAVALASKRFFPKLPASY